MPDVTLHLGLYFGSGQQVPLPSVALDGALYEIANADELPMLGYGEIDQDAIPVLCARRGDKLYAVSPGWLRLKLAFQEDVWALPHLREWLVRDQDGHTSVVVGDCERDAGSRGSEENGSCISVKPLEGDKLFVLRTTGRYSMPSNKALAVLVSADDEATMLRIVERWLGGPIVNLEHCEVSRDSRKSKFFETPSAEAQDAGDTTADR